ncbi:MAG: Sir2 family NAD-dependent protein deacetylase [Thermomicrobium sp.]|nr:Sir2 family NAD-dependent protein deacetylase [Thermomicrobium sp.]MDW8060721.1 Sir2 family NAD-dependent protein deacetylase [Thermomicrobium sp.]
MDPTPLTSEQRRAIERIADALYQRGPGTAFTGAGISTESGIPDYRGPNGLWSRQNPTRFRDFLHDPEVRLRYWERRRERYPLLASAQPNAGHVALARLQAAGYLDVIVTQNIDGLHQKAGSPRERVIELHGTAHAIRCLSCEILWPAERFDIGPSGTVPVCPVCGGIVKEATVAFGEPVPRRLLERALALAEATPVMLVIGTSLVVVPAAHVPRRAARSGAFVAIVNDEPTPLDREAHVVVRARAGAALTYLAELLVGDPAGADERLTSR